MLKLVQILIFSYMFVLNLEFPIRPFWSHLGCAVQPSSPLVTVSPSAQSLIEKLHSVGPSGPPARGTDIRTDGQPCPSGPSPREGGKNGLHENIYIYENTRKCKKMRENAWKYRTIGKCKKISCSKKI